MFPPLPGKNGKNLHVCPPLSSNSGCLHPCIVWFKGLVYKVALSATGSTYHGIKTATLLHNHVVY